MATFCLTQQTKDNFIKSLKDGVIDPFKLASMDSLTRRDFLASHVGKENAAQVNSLFESKLLLQNQKAGYISWAKKVSGISPQTKTDLISKIERMNKVLNPQEEQQFLHDLAATRLKMEVTQEEAKNISDLSTTNSELRAKANKEGIFPSETDRLAYGGAKVALENYVAKLKFEANKLTFKEQPVKKILSLASEVPGILKSTVASLNDHFFGRQGITAILDTRTANIWTKNFLKSFGDIGKTLAGGNVMDAIRADILSRPNALNGKYDAGGYGLNVQSEEAFPSLIPDSIPLLGRLFKASHVAYNGGALRLRADLADRLIKVAEKQGVNTLDKVEAQGMGSLISSLTGRGDIGLTADQQKKINVLFFSVKFLKANIDVLTAGRGVLGFGANEKIMKSTFARKEAAFNLLSIVATIASVLTIAKMLNKDSVQEDPRSKDFGKIKVFGHFVDITRGMGGIVHLASQLVPTEHNGQWGLWTINSSGTYTNLLDKKFGGQTAMDIFNQFWEGKLSPVAGMLRDVWTGKTFSGQPPTIPGLIQGAITPMTIGSYQQLIKDPASSNILGSMILEELGFSTSTSIPPNSKSQMIPIGKNISNASFIQQVLTYANAIGTDPETAFNRIFTGQEIRKVTNGTVIVQRMSLAQSQALKKAGKGNNPQMKLDHTIPLEIGGSNDISNLKLVTTSRWSSYTKVENTLGSALSKGKISKSEAQRIIVKFKGISDPKQFNTYRDAILKKYQ